MDCKLSTRQDKKRKKETSTPICMLEHSDHDYWIVSGLSGNEIHTKDSCDNNKLLKWTLLCSRKLDWQTLEHYMKRITTSSVGERVQMIPESMV